MIDEFAYFFFSYLFERVMLVYVGNAEVEHILVERSRPRFVLRIRYGIAENFIRYGKYDIRYSLSAENRIEYRLYPEIEYVRKDKRKLALFFRHSPNVRISASYALIRKLRYYDVYKIAHSSFREDIVEYFRDYVFAALLKLIFYVDYFIYVDIEHVADHRRKIFAVFLLPAFRVSLRFEE